MVGKVLRTVKKSPETGRLDRAAVREVILSLRDGRDDGGYVFEYRPSRRMMVREPRPSYGARKPDDRAPDAE